MLAKRMKDAGVLWHNGLGLRQGGLQVMAGHGRRGATTEVMDVVSYNTLIKAYVRHNLFDQACGLLLTMRPLPSQVNLQKMSEFSGHIIRSVCEIQIY